MEIRDSAAGGEKGDRAFAKRRFINKMFIHIYIETRYSPAGGEKGDRAFAKRRFIN
jgi:hypothetical protein